MRLLFFIMNKVEKLDSVLTEFVHTNINGATVLDSVGMARILNHKHDEDEIPFLGSLRTFLNPEREKGHIIMAVIKDEQLQDAVNAIEKVVGDLTTKDNGIVFSLPIDFVKGIYESGK